MSPLFLVVISLENYQNMMMTLPAGSQVSERFNGQNKF